MKKLYLVGLGPGDQKMMTTQALEAIDQSEVVAGYPVYLALIKELIEHKEQIATPMRDEERRCILALEAAAAGKTTALVCSGDGGIYGMSGLVYELAGSYESVEIVAVPGITAAISGACVLGAPLMNDFAVVSLSDLLTPWEDIARRLEGAALGDFVICLYNPSSKKRAAHLQRACDLILKHQAADTLCGLVRNIGREGESHELLTLGELREQQVDMFTTVFVGNTKTERIGNRMVVRRGYHTKQTRATALAKDLAKEEEKG